jgi:hypothetical protein
MSGIFKGDSIYKSGGSGGGYKDGGQLVDGDFIEVKNNTISTYDNESRDPVNFYFELTDGEILNSVIEFTTQVNATVNVLIVKDGIYFSLGNIGGNTVTAGNVYTINIVGDSFVIDEVSDVPEPKYKKIEGKLYQIEKIGSLYWTKSNLVCGKEAFGITSGSWPIGKPEPQSTYPGFFYSFNDFNYQKAKEALYPFRLPLIGDWIDLAHTYPNCNDVIQGGYPYFPNATDISNFSAVPCGSYNFNSGVALQGRVFNFLFFKEKSNGHLQDSYGNGVLTLSTVDGYEYTSSSQNTAVGNLRLCCNMGIEP